MKAQAYKIEAYEDEGSWRASWETKIDYSYCLSYVKKQAKELAKANPKMSYRIKGEDGRIYWDNYQTY